MKSSTFRTLATLLALSILSNASRAECAMEREKLTATDETVGAEYGFSVSLNGTRALIGAYGNDVPGGYPGSAYLVDTATGAELHKFEPGDGAIFDWFGWCAALTDSQAIVGAPGDNGVAGNNTGSVYVFDAVQHTLIREMHASDAQTFARFGWAIAAHGPWLLVGAPFHENTGSVGQGAVYLFDAATGAEIRSYRPMNGNNDRFGSSLAMNDTFTVIGAPGDAAQGFGAGAIYVHDTATGNRLYRLVPAGGIARDGFGACVALAGDKIVVGAPQSAEPLSPPGAAYIFDAPTGNQLHKLELDDGETWDFFGSSLSISGNTLLVSTPGEDCGADSSGAVYLYDIPTGIQLDKITASDGGPFDAFGAVATSGNTALVGVGHHDNTLPSSGAAYVFDLAQTGTHFCTANVNATGGAARMSACGDASISANDLTLSALSVPNSFYLFFRGTTQVQVPFGGGFRCAGGMVQRLQGPQLAVGNVARRNVDLPTLGITTPGTFTFQCWFRDGTEPSGFNLSDGLSVTFVP